MQFETSADLNKYMADKSGGVALLSFSTGKDSIASWLVMRRYFTKIVPYYLYPVPGMSFVEDSLKYYEDFFQTRIIRLPHPSLYRMLRNLVFQAPENCAIVEQSDLPTFTYEDICEIIKEDYGLPMDTTYSASGVRARDSLNRWAAIKKYGPINEEKKTFYPVFDFTKADLVRTLLDAKVKLPVDYRMFGRTFDGLDYRFIKGIKEHFPADYERILAFFPMAELELKKIEFRSQHYNQGAIS